MRVDGYPAAGYGVTPGETLLDGGRAVGIPLLFSCTRGDCGVCRARLLEGEVTMLEPNCLTPEERAAGIILTCVCYARTHVTIELPKPKGQR